MNLRLQLGLIVAVVVIAVAGCTALGFWQLRRAAGKELLQARIDAASRLEAIPIEAVDQRRVEAFEHRRVRLEGRWLADRVVYLDNRPSAGRSGFYVLMPLHLDRPVAGDVIVNRGWLPRDAVDQSRIAAYRTDPGTVVVTGVVIAEEPRWLELGGAGSRRLGSIWQNFDYDAYAQASGSAPLRLVVRQDPGVDDGLDRNWPERSGSLQGQIDRHHGYAVQWFAIAATFAALGLYRLVRGLRPKTRGRATT